jgi:trehalose 6-phosphate phosphatase
MQSEPTLPHALECADRWIERWRARNRLVLLLDFDGTLAPIVARPELAAIPAETRLPLERLVRCPAVDAAVVSGRGMGDARRRAQIEGIAYAGNHGMEIEGPGVRQIHAEAEAARPRLQAVRDRVRAATAQVAGALVEDKGLTLSVHYRMVDRERVPEVVAAVEGAVDEQAGLRLTRGKEVLEVRPAVDWDKGRAVEFLLDHLRPQPGVPVLYLGDDTTDEDAFRALRRWGGGEGEGVIVADPVPEDTAARAFVRTPAEVGALLNALATRGPC